jgi:hypothetical protein
MSNNSLHLAYVRERAREISFDISQNSTKPEVAMNDLSERLQRISDLLGVEVVAVERDAPAHDRSRQRWNMTRRCWEPAMEQGDELGSEQVARQRWRLQLRHPGDDRAVWIELTSMQVRERVRHVTDTPRAGRTALRLLHEEREDRER